MSPRCSRLRPWISVAAAGVAAVAVAPVVGAMAEADTLVLAGGQVLRGVAPAALPGLVAERGLRLGLGRTAAIDTLAAAGVGSNGGVGATAMPYEPGSPECRVLIDCKGQIESMLLALGRIDNSQHIRDQLLSVHNQLEGLHALHRKASFQLKEPGKV